MSIEAMKQALDALEEHGTHYARHEDNYIKAITALREAIEQAEKREWVGLTRDERMEIINRLAGHDWVYVIDAIEAKLKEKNT